MTEQKERELTRRRFVKLSFGILTLSIQARSMGFLKRLEEVGAWATSDAPEATVRLAPVAQYLQSRPSLTAGLTLGKRDKHGILRGRNALLRLNDSAFFALSHCDGRHTVSEICVALSEHFGLPAELIQDDVVTLLNCLYRLDMMTFTITRRLDHQYAVKDAGTSRWETITA
jgi:hypothetical protein